MACDMEKNTEFDELGRHLFDNNLPESLWNDKCDYIDINKCTNLNPCNFNLNVLQLNIRSLLSHQHELRLILQQLDKRNSTVDIVALCETFLTKKIEKLVNIPGYTFHCKNRTDHKGGGVGLLIRNGIHHCIRKDLGEFVERESEHLFIEIASKCGKKIIVGSSYRAPNTNPAKFISHLENVISTTRTGKIKREIVLCMDHNLDLLKCHLHEPTKQFHDSLFELGLFPTITRPTRITQTTATLIDNIFVSKKLYQAFDSCIILNDISDHLPTLALLKQTKMLNKEPLEFVSRNLNEKKISRINEKLSNVDWVGTLKAHEVNQNFNCLNDIIRMTVDEIAPRHIVKVSSKRRFVEPWMTTSLECSANKKQLLYKKTLHANCTQADITMYKSYRNTYNRVKRRAQEQYYRQKALDYKKNTRKLWQLINNVIRKRSCAGNIIPYITVDGIKISNPSDIANNFGKFYSTLGESLAQNIPRSKVGVNDYLAKIPRNLHSMVLFPTSHCEIDKAIANLPSKTSSGYDDKSNVLLKSLRTSLSYPLTLIMNQSLETGVFPDRMKLAEVIPLYKNKAMDHLVNYRPISLLITISKILEKIMYKRVISFINKSDILFKSQYGFRRQHSCEQAVQELLAKILHSQEDGHKTASIFMDLSKAFDTLNHDLLLQKMERYGIRGVPLKWFKSYLAGRSLVAKVQTSENKITYSSTFNVSCGAAQGSCLGPLLFILFCNDIYLQELYGSLILLHRHGR